MRLEFRDFVFDSALRTLSRGGTRIQLTPKAFALLDALIVARPSPVSKEKLYEILWPDTFVEPGNLHNLISEIRTALDDESHSIVATARGFGYAFLWTGRTAKRSRYAAAVGREVFVLHDGENIVGRDPAAAVFIDSPDVSRAHARIIVHPDGVTVEDLGSKNGTFINSERLTTPRAISSGDAFHVGRFRIVLHEVGASTITSVRGNCAGSE